MKKVTILLAVLLTACSSGPVFQAPSENYRGTADSHTYVNIYLSSFYCENNRWPESLKELEEYRLPWRYKSWIFKPVNWHDFSYMQVKYIPSSVILTAPEIKLGTPLLASIHFQPECNNGKIISTKYEITKN